MNDESQRWYSVRCIFHKTSLSSYEERITLWRADSADDAIVQAEGEAAEYAGALDDMHYIGFAQAYMLYDDPREAGAEVFSLYRDSDLSPDEYLDRFFDTGAEREQHQD